MRSWKVIASVLGFLWLLFGALAGHDVLHGKALDYFQKAHEYHIVHTVMILLIARYHTRLVSIICGLWFIGIVLFSGSLYAMAVWNFPLNYAVPFGGMAFLSGWILLIVFFYRHSQS